MKNIKDHEKYKKNNENFQNLYSEYRIRYHLLLRINIISLQTFMTYHMIKIRNKLLLVRNCICYRTNLNTL